MALTARCLCGCTVSFEDATPRARPCPACRQPVSPPRRRSTETSGDPAPREVRERAAPPERAPPPLAYRPRPEPSPEPPRSRPAADDEHTARDRRDSERLARAGGWNRRYAVLLVLLLPLFLHMLAKDDDPGQRLGRQLEKAPPEVVQRLERMRRSQGGLTRDDLCAALPGDRVEGALLARSSKAHWLLAALTAAGFAAALTALFRPDPKFLRDLGLVGLFTGTVGIFMLLAIQAIAFRTGGLWIHGGGLLSILFFILSFIGFSYRAALDPSNGFGASFFGFTFGVGFCEELCKALPLVHHFRSRATFDWRSACLWGLASGVGFGISEGISYSGDFYNGFSTGGIYIVRFVSCVALHGFWSAAIGIVLFKRQETIQGDQKAFELIPPLLMILAVPMVLHGLYDTFLKREMALLALVIALASFGWLAWQIEYMRDLEARGEL